MDWNIGSIKILETNKEKCQYYARNGINILSLSLYTFYELLFSNFTTINSDGKVIITKFFKVMDNLDLSLTIGFVPVSEYSES
ncbi:hypothetical protein RhiirC2_749982 [Rhizophagus irregularis]|uniref:Uncharacterized protein n=1 Tax=Rhizophagus irregularis TaxID=588596 RepID=A0A2N1N3W6_9GLOM|nr:hypothetical protein RhiirC2_749982 [Rhizophagus irregularis]